jgi:hypothetical protein
MVQPHWCPACDPSFALGSLVSFESVKTELAPVDALSREVDDLTGVLQARLAPDQFRLVWSLRDAVERLALADEMLRGRVLIDVLAHHFPSSERTIRELGWQLSLVAEATDALPDEAD